MSATDDLNNQLATLDAQLNELATHAARVQAEAIISGGYGRVSQGALAWLAHAAGAHLGRLALAGVGKLSIEAARAEVERFARYAVHAVLGPPRSEAN